MAKSLFGGLKGPASKPGTVAPPKPAQPQPTKKKPEKVETADLIWIQSEE